MILTKRQWDVLEILHLKGEDIVMEGGQAFVGDERTSVALVYSLLRLCVISQDGYSDIQFNINGTGVKALSAKYEYRNSKYHLEYNPFTGEL